MKQIIPSLMALAVTSSAFAQWSTGTNINNENTGNVGINIGTTTPTIPLTIGDAAGIVRKNSTTPYFLIRGWVDTYLQTVAAPGSNWSRAALSTNLHWNNAAGNWRVDGDLYSDFGSMNFENNGNIAFYTRGTVGSSYDISHSALATYKRLAISNDGIIHIPGRLGVGTTAPISAFQVGDGNNFLSIGQAWAVDLKYGTSYIGFNAGRNNGNWTVRGDGAHNGGAVIYSNIVGDIFFAPLPSTGTGQQTFSDAEVKGKIALHITPEAVVRAKNIRVELTNWPDFVFKPDYKLLTLTEVKNYIDKNHHLPDMPSADEVHKEGIDLGEMNRLLIKKVEELTLYLLEQNRKNEALQKEVATLIKRVDKNYKPKR
ncbi:hypothetical protein [Mucilaginibacter auburnensis]|uniref:Endosialidase-like protein n=1 Tax=Mucilaginibacter auburnensis TaxID=1457233 RepID=A0A2H9VRA0_9SPHI|nr:hypothetical protein [Mucilaginibacter auburnensis]PJJ83342.1 hypothetical protein CLV57_0322 [Mucilaginibacter auburnensis]